MDSGEMKQTHRRQNKYYTQMSKVIWQMAASPLSCRPHSSAAGTWQGDCVSLCDVRGSSVAEWLACWTQAQKGLGSNLSRDPVG